MDERTRHRAHARYIVKADVSRCYPSIYTHSIPWAAHSKPIAKALTTSRNLYGNDLDRHVRNAQGKQTIGIPVGPDTSFAIAEMVLSAADQLLLKSSRRAHGFRLYDDYELYAASSNEANKLLLALEEALAEYELAINPHKVAIDTLPQPLEADWRSRIRSVPYRRGTPMAERSDLTLLFDTSFRAAAANRHDSVLAYALGRFISQNYEERKRIRHPENWKHFQRLALQAAIAEPGVLAKVAHILHWEKARGRPIEVLASETVNAIALEAATRGFASEVAWAIWTAISLGLKIAARPARAISRMGDDVVALLTLHARDLGIIGPGFDATLWQSWMTGAQLHAEHWLLAYEAYEHGWLTSATGRDYIASDALASHMRGAGVRFYDDTASLPAPPATKVAPAVSKSRRDVAASSTRRLDTADVVPEEADEEEWAPAGY
ncbi:MAG: RNA-directed DNA polymerase [Chloroflexota bacterium]|nr:RNA-directed DNA polymerase [Chloroflexota bacterium]